MRASTARMTTRGLAILLAMVVLGTPAGLRSETEKAESDAELAEEVQAPAPETESMRAVSEPKCDLESYDIAVPKMTEHVLYVKDFGAIGDGVSDDTKALEKAVQSASPGATLVFEPGKTYLKRRLLQIRVPGLVLWGYGARLYSQYSDRALKRGKGKAPLAIRLEAPGAALYGLTVVSNLRKQIGGSGDHSGVAIASDRNRVIDNRFEYLGNGVIVYGREFTVARNVVYRTYSDGIHVTGKAWDGRILCNTVRETGDDMIAVVGYGAGTEPVVGQVLIEANDVAGNYWGRGITAVGARDVTIRGNRIATTTRGAGILVTSEKYWKTANTRGILVEGNTIENVQTTKPAYNPHNKNRGPSGQGAIDVNGEAGQAVSDVVIRGNVVTRAFKDGVFVRGNSCNVLLENNRLDEAWRSPVRIETEITDACPIRCSGNQADGKPLADGMCKTKHRGR
jgi:hypothetical protein